jgi:Spy/CpxP family protein refolding chaperone
MNKIIAAALTLLALTTGSSFAQRGNPYPNDRDYQYDDSRYRGRNDDPRRDRDQFQDELKIERLDDLVKLSRRQERELHRIEDRYDQVMNTSRMTPDGFRQLRFRKRQDMLAVLTPAQRDRLFDAQEQRYGNRRGNGYGSYGRRG